MNPRGGGRGPRGSAGLVWLGLGILLLLLAGTALAGDEEASEREIEALRVRIVESRQRVESTERSERDLLRRIEELDRGLEALRIQVERSRRRADETAEAHIKVEARRADAALRLATTRRAMSRRAVALYKAGEAGPLQLLFASADLPQMLARMGNLERLLIHDSELVARYVAEHAEVAVLQEEAEAARVEAEAAHARLVRRSGALSDERSARTAALRSVRQDRSREGNLLAELESAAQGLQETLAAFRAERARYAGARFAARKGALPRPVAGPVRRPFGRLVDPQYKTEVFHKGFEIAARRGDPVRAVAPGTVRLAGWFRGYGKLVILDHGDGYFTVSGHLADIDVEVGDRVLEGEVLGTVGDTGSLEGPGLYFEVRRGRGPLNPAEWLATG